DALQGEPLPTGSVRVPNAGQVSALPGFDDGAWWVQDAGAALAVGMLDVVPGTRVLDLCAAPGGKTMQLAAAGAEVTALDMSKRRMARLDENLSRTGLAADVVVADALEWQPPSPFEAILLDAPCSATGTLRRHPDLGYAKDGAELDALKALQLQLFDRAFGWLPEGGRLVYCVCSLLPEEGEAQLAAAAERHPNLAIEDVLPPGADPDWRAIGGGLRIRPDYWADRGGIDGFFMAAVRKMP
ncbi:MAG: RsmB/NOP family class I SAM-dependent RNA methyltransferase, partial [Pseudomonadota bacterium]